jgi:uncharacterized cupin superfamily protein
MKKIDISVVPSESGGTIPKPFDEPCIAQSCRRLARFAGLTRFGVNVTAIEAGAWSSQRHWLSHEDEFVWVLEGELTLVTDAGEETLRAGDCAAFKSGDPDGQAPDAQDGLRSLFGHSRGWVTFAGDLRP